MTHERFELLSHEGELLRADLRYEKDGRKKPVIIFLHGFKGFKDWGPFPAMLEELATDGFVTLAFNFSYNGIGEDLLNFTELDRFARNTFTRELEEVGDVIRAIDMLDEKLPIAGNEIARDNIGLIGHSRGAAMAVLAGSTNNLVRAVIALSPVRTFERYSERQKEEWRRKGYFEVLNQRTKQVMRLNIQLLEDLELHREQLDIVKAAHRYPFLEKPLLVMAGEQDLTTKPAEAEAVATAAAGDLTELRLIPNTGHTFGAEHPYKGMTPALRQVIDHSKAFFEKYLIHHPIPSVP